MGKKIENYRLSFEKYYLRKKSIHLLRSSRKKRGVAGGRAVNGVKDLLISIMISA